MVNQRNNKTIELLFLLCCAYAYTYDENGIRTSKEVGGITTYFNTSDGIILSQSDDENTLIFQYDNGGLPVGFTWNGTQYYYLTNSSGDVLGICDTSGEVLVEYTYDEWGKLIDLGILANADEDLAEINPLRYRGYYYDEETGFYYLQSRYYNPEICRFISEDDIEVLSDSFDRIQDQNMFLYCNNSPINYVDYDGREAILIIAGVSVSTAELIAMTLVVIATIYIISPEFRSAINTASTEIVNQVSLVSQQLIKAIKDAYNKAKRGRKYKQNHVHHIVAKAAKAANTSRTIYKMNKLNTEMKFNKVSINKTLHAHLHTTAYYTSINNLVKKANKINSSNKNNKKIQRTSRYRIISAITIVGCVLKVAGKKCA